MSESLKNTFLGVSTLCLAVIAIELIPINKRYQIEELCTKADIFQPPAKRNKVYRQIEKTVGLEKNYGYTYCRRLSDMYSN